MAHEALLPWAIVAGYACWKAGWLRGVRSYARMVRGQPKHPIVHRVQGWHQQRRHRRSQAALLDAVEMHPASDSDVAQWMQQQQSAQPRAEARGPEANAAGPYL
jgi:hypothetical protein